MKLKLSKALLLGLLAVIFCVSIITPAVIKAEYKYIQNHSYWIDVNNEVEWSADGSTDVFDTTTEPGKTIIIIGRRVDLETKEIPYETQYTADYNRDFGSENLTVTNGKKGVIKRFYVKETDSRLPGFNTGLSVSGKLDSSENRWKKGDILKRILTVKNSNEFPVYDVQFAAGPVKALTYDSSDVRPTAVDGRDLWFYFDKIEAKGSKTITISYRLTQDCDGTSDFADDYHENPACSLRPSFKVSTPDYIAKNTKEQLVQQKEDEVVSVGVKPKTETIVIPHKKLEPKAGFEIIPGKDGSKDIVTTYTVDKQTGKVTPKVEEKNYVAPVDETYKAINYTYEGDPEIDYGKERKDDAKKIIYKGIKPKTEHVVIPHKKLEPKAGFEIIPGKDGSKDIVTTYTVDKQTGKVTPKTEERNLVAPVDETYKAINYTYEGDPEMDYGKERKDEAKKIIYKGIRPKIEHVVIPHKKLEPKAGFEIIPGKDGSKDIVTTYTVDPKTGKVTPKVEEKNLVAPVDETYKEINYTYEGDPEMDYGKERKDEAKKIIYKGIKPKVEHVVIPHKKLEPKAGFEIIPGKDGSKDIVTTYTVDKQTGKVTLKTEEKNLVKPVDERYKEKQTTKPTSTTKPNKSVKPSETVKKPQGIRIINNNLNQVKTLPKTLADPGFRHCY